MWGRVISTLTQISILARESERDRREEETSGGCCEDSSKVEIEHIAYREISTVCAMMNAPLYLLSAWGEKKKEKCLAEIMKCSPFYHPRALVQEFSLETESREVF